MTTHQDYKKVFFKHYISQRIAGSFPGDGVALVERSGRSERYSAWPIPVDDARNFDFGFCWRRIICNHFGLLSSWLSRSRL